MDNGMKYFKKFENYSNDEESYYDELQENFGHYKYSFSVWHGSIKPTNQIEAHDEMFFTDSENYAYSLIRSRYGRVNLVEAMIFGNNILDLEQYNHILRKHGKVGLGTQGYFTIHKDSIDEKWKMQIINLDLSGHKEIVNKFLSELESCDIIVGEDVGNTGHTVYYVKKAEQIYIP
jgi:hypothetical protein